MKTIARVLRIILLGALVASCSLLERDFYRDGDFGTLEIELSAELEGARTLVPPVAMDISRWNVSGSLEGGGDSFTTSVDAGERFTRSGLTPGLWTIAIDGVNPDGITIGHGETTAQIVAGSTTTAQITILPLSGNGTLSLTIQWDKKLFTTEVIAAEISPPIPAGGTLPFTIKTAGQNREGTYSSSAVPAGYYVLTLQLIGDGAVVWGTMEAVRILAGQTTNPLPFVYTP